MASQNKIIQMIASIKTIYSYYAKETDVEVLVKTWTLLLNDYPDNAVEIAFLKCLKICKMPPTPADVIEQLNSMIETTEQSDEELWSVYTKAIYETENQMYRFGYTFIEANGKTQGDNARAKVTEVWNGLPERLKQYIGSKGELMRIARTYNDDELKYEKTRFLKTLPIIKKREEYTGLKALLGDERLLIGGSEQ